MRIEVSRIPTDGMTVSESLTPQALDLETEIIKFRGPVTVLADISRITNAVTVDFTVQAKMYLRCSRCLEEFDMFFNKEFQVSFPVDISEPSIDLDPEIREEIILEYPIKPLCKAQCKGLCPKCGKNLNEINCGCKDERIGEGLKHLF